MQVCVEGYYFDEKTYTCAACSWSGAGILLSVVFGLPVTLAALYLIISRLPAARATLTAHTAWLALSADYIGLWPSLKIAFAFVSCAPICLHTRDSSTQSPISPRRRSGPTLTFTLTVTLTPNHIIPRCLLRDDARVSGTQLQVVGFIPEVYEVQLPESYLGVWSTITNFGNTVRLKSVFPCESFFGALALIGFGPFVLIAVVFVLGTLAKLSAGETLGRGARLGGLPPTLLIGYVMVPVASVKLFSSFNCVSYESDTAGGVDVRFLRDSLDVTCSDNSSEYSRILRLSFVLMALWPIGGTMLCAWLLRKCRHAIVEHRPSVLSRACRFLYQEMQPAYYYWEVIVLIERIVLCGATLLIPQDRSFIRLIFAMLFTTTSAVVIMLAQPYRRDVHNYLSVAAHLVLQIIFIGALVASMGLELRLSRRPTETPRRAPR